MAERMSVLYDASKCTDCGACSVACKQWNTLPAEKTNSLQGHTDFTPRTWTFVSSRESFENKKMQWMFRKQQCMHCGDAACIKVCSTGAISRNDLGFVVIDQNKCIGDGYCVNSCPFHIPRVDESAKKSYKCNGCPDRLANGMKPACVQTCQPEALVYGDRKAILQMADDRVKALLPKYPKANVYGATSLDGLNFTYILLREPDYYGLPANPTVPVELTVWKDVFHPLGLLMVAGAFGMTLLHRVMQRGQNENHPSDKDTGSGKGDAKG